MHLLTLAIVLTALSSLKLCAAWDRTPCQLDGIPNRNGRHEYLYQELYNLHDRFWNTFVNGFEKEAQSKNSLLFSKGCQGRVDNSRTYTEREGNTDFIFGTHASIKAASADRNKISLFGYPTAYRITAFTGTRDITAASIRVNFTNPMLALTLPMEILSWMQWDANGMIRQYDMSYRYFAPYLNATMMATLPVIKGTKPVDAITYFHGTLAETICAIHAKHCSNQWALRQWDNEAGCKLFLLNHVRFGHAHELGRNTLLCRALHAHMVPSRPDDHCKHLGPKGGGVCVDAPDYVGTVMEKFFDTAFFPLDPPEQPRLDPYYQIVGRPGDWTGEGNPQGNP